MAKGDKVPTENKSTCTSCVKCECWTGWVKALSSLGLAIAAIITAIQTSNIVSRITSLESKFDMLDTRTQSLVASNEIFLANSFVEKLPTGGTITYSEVTPFIAEATGINSSSFSQMFSKPELETTVNKYNQVSTKEEKAQVLKDSLDTIRKPPTTWTPTQLQEYLSTGKYPDNVLLKKKQ